MPGYLPWLLPVIPRWMLLVAGWAAGVFLTFYGGLNLAVRGLMAIGMLETPESMYSAAARWHLLFWDPWWLLGGILFLAAVWHFQRSSRIRKLPVQSA
ncbi:MAG TPA: DUF3995 domain-containing protein [Bacillales bacterium]|nr:DUF3995 domain-containing protein [Bacillales bacterium]